MKTPQISTENMQEILSADWWADLSKAKKKHVELYAAALGTLEQWSKSEDQTRQYLALDLLTKNRP